MARAKMTERAEARRRYRAYLQEQQEQAAAENAQGTGDLAPASPATAKASRTTPDQVVRPGQKVGIFSAFKLATRPVHYLDDLRYAPTLILKTNAIWPSALFSIVALAFGLTRTDYNDSSIGFLVTFALPMMPLIQPMFAGFLAPRATWLAGLISGIVSGLCLEILIIWWVTGHIANLPANQSLSATQFLSSTVEVFLTGMTFGAVLGAASGWYKRFLTLASPAPARTQRSASKKPAPRRSSARR